MKNIYFLSIIIIALFGNFSLNSQNCFQDWQYNMPVYIDNSGGDAATDYEVKLTIDTESLIGSGQ